MKFPKQTWMYCVRRVAYLTKQPIMDEKDLDYVWDTVYGDFSIQEQQKIAREATKTLEKIQVNHAKYILRK